MESSHGSRSVIGSIRLFLAHYKMDTQKETMFRTYAWSYFAYHADQRMKTFNFFLIVAGLFAGALLHCFVTAATRDGFVRSAWS